MKAIQKRAFLCILDDLRGDAWSPVMGLYREECIGETQVMEAAELQEALASLVELADAKAANAAGSGVMVSPHRALKSTSRNRCSLVGICWILASSSM